jgi:hypothetical protein
MQKKTKLSSLVALLAVGQVSFAAESGKDQPPMMKGMSSMMEMMGDQGMKHMMDAMNSPKGQEMMKSCRAFMESYNGKEDGGKTK